MITKENIFRKGHIFLVILALCETLRRFSMQKIFKYKRKALFEIHIAFIFMMKHFSKNYPPFTFFLNFKNLLVGKWSKGRIIKIQKNGNNLANFFAETFAL